MPVSNKFRKYNSSEKGRARNRRCEESHPNRYNHSAEGKKEYYHRCQELAGSHHEPREIFPAYRLLKSFETAEIVEI